MNETKYRRELIKRIETVFPGCFITRSDPRENQGIPDILILFRDQWAMLEIKISSTAERQPNQDYYVEKFNGMSFAAFINPENEVQVMDDLQHAFRSRRKTRVS